MRTRILAAIFLFVFVRSAAAAELKPVRKVLGNGIVLLTLERPTLPIVSVNLLVKAGSILDPEEKAGLANLTSSLLDEGTKKRSATAIADAVDFIGARLSASADEDYATISLKILKKDLAIGMDLLADIAQNPAFDEKEVERVKKNVIGEIVSEKDEPTIVAQRAFDNLVFGRHPYHRSVRGLEESVPKITRNDLAKFHETYYRPNNATISIVGALTPAEAEEAVKKFLGGWKKGEIRFPAIPPPPRLQKKKVELIDKDLTQASVLLGHVGIDRKNPDYYTVTIMNYILGGGGFSSRMMSEIRDNRGLVYSIYSRYAANLYPGAFAVSLQTKNASAKEAIQGVLAQIAAMRESEPTDSELAEAKSYLIGSFPLRIDTTTKIANLLSVIEFYGLGLDYVEKYPTYIQKVSKKDVRKVARKYLDPQRYALVVVANQSQAKIDTAGISGGSADEEP